VSLECGVYRWRELSEFHADSFESGGYVLDDFRADFTHQLSGSRLPLAIDLRYMYRWAMVYPGWRTCTFKMFDRSGKLVAEDESRLIAERSGWTEGALQVSVEDLPESLDVECGERTDDPTGYHEVEVASLEDLGAGTALVSWTAHWLGDRRDGASDCTIEFLNDEGAILFQHEFTIWGAGDQGTDDMPVEVPQHLDEAPASARASCVPWRPPG
jgi:hypothetical protein